MPIVYSWQQGLDAQVPAFQCISCQMPSAMPIVEYLYEYRLSPGSRAKSRAENPSEEVPEPIENKTANLHNTYSFNQIRQKTKENDKLQITLQVH